MNRYLLIILLSLLPLVSMFLTSDLPHTHDGLVHLPRIAAYFKALADGQIPVRWAGDLNYGYGMPLFNFIYQLPYLIASFFLFLGFGLVNAFKITLALSYILSGIFMLAFARNFFNDDKKALLAAVFYQFAPFRLIELLVRGSFGEVYTYTFLPLILLGLTLLFRKFSYKNFLLTSFGIALLVISHNSVSLLFFAVAVAFLIFFAKTKKNLIIGGLALSIGLLLSAFYWLPAIVEHQYTHGDLFMKNVYLSNFVPLWQFFVPNFLNSKLLQTENISVQFGLFHEIAIVISIWLLLKKKLDEKTKKLIYFCLLLVVISLLFMQPVSKIIWANVSFLRQFQFPWRFLSVVVFAATLLSANYLNVAIFKKKLAYVILLILVVVSTAYWWKPQAGFDKINEGDFWNYPLTTTYYGETDVEWSAGPKGAYADKQVEIIGGKGTITDITKKLTTHTFRVDAQTEVNLVDHTQYFPGWRAYVDGKIVPIQFQDQNWRGEITFLTAKGIHDVKVSFGESPIRLFADIVSLTTFILLLPILKFALRKIKL